MCFFTLSEDILSPPKASANVESIPEEKSVLYKKIRNVLV